MKKALLLIFCILPFILTAQQAFETQINTSPNDIGWGITQNANNDILMTGSVTTPSGKGIVLIKADSAGNLVDTMMYDTTQFSDGMRVITTSDGGYFIAGQYYDYELGRGEYRGYGIKLDKNFEKEWTTRLKMYIYEPDGPVHDVVETDDGGFLIAGKRQNRAFWNKVNSEGKITWSKSFVLYQKAFQAHSISRKDNGNYIISGWRSFDSTFPSTIGPLWYEVDQTSGARIDSHALSLSVDAKIYSSSKASDGTVFTGIFGGDELLFLKTDPTNNNPVSGYPKTITLSASSVSSIDFVDMEHANDCSDRFLITGTYTDGSGDQHTFLMEVDGNGGVVWEKYFSDASANTKSYQVITSNDGGILVGGYLENGGTSNFNIIKTDADGDVCNNFPGIVDVQMDTFVVGEAITFTPIISGGNGSLSYTWSGDDGLSSTAQSPTHTYSDTGWYEICLIVTDGTCTSQFRDSVFITLPPVVASFSYTVTGTQVCYTDNSTGSPSSWDWSLDNGLYSTQQDPCVDYSIGGTWDVCLIASNAHWSDTVCQTVVTDAQPPDAIIDWCADGRTVNFYNASTDGPHWFVEWSGDMNNIGDDTVTHTFPSDGCYNINLEVFNNQGSDMDFELVCVSSGDTWPLGNFSYTISGTTVSFTDLSTNSPDSWEWDIGNNDTVDYTTQNPSHDFGSPGTYTVCLTPLNDASGLGTCAGQDTCMTIEIVEPPTADFSFNANDQCELIVSFSDESTYPQSWLWDFDDGNTSTSQSPEHQYTTTGTFNVCLTVTNSVGTDSICKNVTINALTPEAVAVSDRSTICVGESVTFADATECVVTGWTWDFGSGASPANANTDGPHTVTYSTAGTKSIILTVTGPGGTDDTTININVTNTPTTSAISGNTTVCENETSVTYSVTDDGFVYDWEVPAGATIVSGDGTNSITVNFGATGGDIEVTPGTGSGCTGTTTTLTVSTTPAPSTSAISGPATVCEDSTATYSVTNTAGSTYDWDIPAGASIASGQGTSSIDVDFGSTGGNITVTETNSAGCEGSVQSVSVTIAPTPSTSAISGPATVCPNETGITYSVTSTGGSTYNWNVPADASIISGQGSNSVTVDWGTSAGTVSVTETSSAGCSGNSVTYSVSVASLPSTSAISGPAAVCAGESATYSVTSTGGSTYDWDVPADATITGGQGSNSIDVDFGSTTGDVTVTETNANGCEGSPVTFTVTVNPKPSTSAISGNTNACWDETETYSVTGSAGSTFNWTVTGGSISSGQGTDNLEILWGSGNSGTVSVTETSADGCTGNPQTLNVSLKNCDIVAPVADFAYTINCLKVNFINQTNGEEVSKYSWSLGDGNNSPREEITHEYLVPGTYTVCLTAENRVGKDDTCMTVKVEDCPSGDIDQLRAAIKIYPNPVRDRLYIELSDQWKGTVKLFNMLGQEVINEKMIQGTLFYLNLKEYAEGVYVLQVETENGLKINKKLIISRP